MCCEFDDFQEANLISRIFKATFHFLLKIRSDGINQAKLPKLLFAMKEVTSDPVEKLEWDKVVFDGQSKRYEFLFILARLFLQRKSIHVPATHLGANQYCLICMSCLKNI